MDDPLGAASTGCAGPQSALAPAGRDADRIAELTAWMTVGSLVVWVLVLLIGARALGRPPADPRTAERWVVGVGGVLLPTVLLAVVLGKGLPVLPKVLDPGTADWSIAVSGEQFWWRVRYDTPDGPIDLANELRLPVGERVPVVLRSPDVIHSLWIPSLAGKMDLIPGRTTVLPLEPTVPGVYRGACAEYCGASHAHMALWVVVLARDAFDAWLAGQRAPAVAPSGALAERGAAAFLANGCGACHTVRGTSAVGRTGPDLTHVGGRESLAAGRLPNDAEGFRTWLEEPSRHKPGARMPAFALLGDADLVAIAAWLDGLR